MLRRSSAINVSMSRSGVCWNWKRSCASRTRDPNASSAVTSHTVSSGIDVQSAIKLRFERRTKSLVPGYEQQQAQGPEDALSGSFARHTVDFGDRLLLLRRVVLEAWVFATNTLHMRSRLSPREARRCTSSIFGGTLGSTTMMPGSGKLVARAAAPFDVSGRPDASAPTPSLMLTASRTR